ncbi:uncharacterized protein CGFF_05017 [Nakaseomyces glabratus]|nr:hypothetical protein J6894_02767 [Nakaseomyces glabratus]KAI8396227.1 hypothetical protein J6895_02791 [Nakaseomyces glabratus]QNG14846.1 uncharacterized protein GWK60_I05621 [Nakaseomyces glabratus]SCV17455.1 uncharacterized protein CGFF_05017 [Nakaseomyces glabratus]SLM17244.1 uncharacterized protein CGFF_05017 [Nakaseomyces glabratus]
MELEVIRERNKPTSLGLSLVVLVFTEELFPPCAIAVTLPLLFRVVLSLFSSSAFVHSGGCQLLDKYLPALVRWFWV